MWFRSTSIIWKSVRNADLQTHIAVCRSTTKGMNPRDLMVSKRKYVEQEYTADFGLLNYKVDFHCQSLIYWLLIFLFLATSCSTWDPSFPTRDLSDPSSLQLKLGVLTTGQLGKSYWFLNFMTEFKKMKVVKWPFSHTIKFFTQQRIMIINFFIRFSSQVLKREKKMQVVKNLPANAGDAGLIPRSGRSPEEGNGNPLQYSCLGNPMDREAWWASLHGVTKESDMT